MQTAPLEPPTPEAVRKSKRNNLIGLILFTLVVVIGGISLVVSQINDGCIHMRGGTCISLLKPNFFWLLGPLFVIATVVNWVVYFKKDIIDETFTESADPAVKRWPVRVAKGRWLSLWDQPMILEVADGKVKLSKQGHEVFESAPKDISVTRSGLVENSFFLTIRSGSTYYRLDFRVDYKSTRSANNQQAYQNRNDFLQIVSGPGAADQ